MVTVSINDPRIMWKYNWETFSKKLNSFFEKEFWISEEVILYEIESDILNKNITEDFKIAKKIDNSEYIDY